MRESSFSSNGLFDSTSRKVLLIITILTIGSLVSATVLSALAFS